MLLTYDGIALPYSNCVNFEQTSVFDPVGQTDFVAVRFDVECEFLVNTNYLGLMSPDLLTLPSRTPTDIMVVLGQRLRRRRRALSIKFNGREMCPAPTGGPGTVDVMNGPIPEYFTYQKLTGETFLCRYKISAHYLENQDVTQVGEASASLNKPGSPVLYNRWTESTDIDEQGMSIRTRDGRFAIRSDNVQGITADTLRSVFASVGVPDGFVRQSSKYVQSPDGLTVAYTHVDREVFKYPPPGAMKASGTYREAARGFNACFRYAEVDIKLQGFKGQDQAKLLFTAIKIAAFKLQLAHAEIGEAAPAKVKSQPQSIVVEADMYKNEVSVKIVSRFQGNKRDRGTLNLLRQAFCFTPFSEGGAAIQPTYFDRGSAGLLLQAAAYYDPTLVAARLVNGKVVADDNPQTRTGNAQSQMNTGLKPGQAGRIKEG